MKQIPESDGLAPAGNSNALKMTDVRYRNSIESGKCGVRLAAKGDARLLWAWANDPSTRQQSFRQEFISWSDHEAWFSRILSANRARLWILELEKVPVGQIRYEQRTSETAEISFSVAEPFRGRGIGSQLLLLTLAPAARELNVGQMRGITFVNNIPSQRAFLSAGFEVRERAVIQGNPCLVFERSCEADVLRTEDIC
ncbi:MAG TPA: GNAT family N-acetyltransferase [Candidatus Binatia bacterium]